LGIPGTPHRVLSEEDPGYIAAKFEGKQKQMEQGQWN
jgi:glutamate dehydrogenase